MIIRGNAADIAINRTGHLAPDQQARLKMFKAYRLPALPSALFGILLIALSFTRQDWLSWVILAGGFMLLFSAIQRQRSQKNLATGAVQTVVGTLEQVRSVPMAMFESELRIDGKNYVLLSKLGSTPLEIGTHYRFFVAQNISRMGIIVGIEQV
ncbi:MAG: hypothetical protein KAX40_00640 [Herpetosiphon sp.]|nr:hypothetical protein [Herpetosiphon sp.]